MSGISIERFMQVARETSTGDIRMRFEDQTKLVNKGTFFNRLATFQGKGGDIESKNQRTQTAIDRFRTALTDRYGAAVGNDALNQALLEHNEGLEDGQQQRFTGRVVMRAAQLALDQARANQATNKQILENTPLHHADPEVKQAFAARLEHALAVRTGCFRQTLSDGDLNDLKYTVRQQVMNLSFIEDGLTSSNDKRKQLTETLQSVLVSITNKQPPGDLVPKLLEVQRLQDELVAIERDDHRETGGEKTRAQIFDALRKQERAYPGFIADLQKRSLHDTSSLRAVYATATQIYGNEASSQEQKRNALKLMDQCDALISVVSSTSRPLLELSTEDRARFRDVGTVNAERLGEAQRTLAPIFVQWERATEKCRDFLDTVRTDNDLQKLVNREGGIRTHGWDSPELCRKLEDSVRNSVDEATPYADAIKNYRTGIERDQTLHPGLKDKMLATLDALEAEREVAETMKDMRWVGTFPEGEIWRLVVPGDKQGKGASKWDLDQQVQGSYAGLCRGLSVALKQTKDNDLLTGANLGQVHEAVTKDNIRQGDIRYLYGEATTRTAMDQARDTHRVDGGFRQGDRNVWLGQEDITDAGRREITQYAGYDHAWFGSSGPVNDEVKLTLQWTDDASECRLRANDILDRFSKKTEGKDIETKLTMVANTVQQLHRSQLFMDDDGGKTAVTLMTNRLLLSLGLSPTILADPGKVMGCSVDEFFVQIREGQKRFAEIREGNV